MTRINKLDALGILQEHGAILDGHFRMPSGLHTERFVETALVLQYPHLAHKLAKALSDRFPADVDVVASSAMGGVVLGQEVARVRGCRAIFFERRGEAMGLRRSFRLEPGERALIVEDVLMAGRTTAEVLSLLGAYGVKVAGVGALLDRSTGPLPLTVPVRTLVSLPIKVVPAEACDPCRRGIPLTGSADGISGGG
ncbi:MAG: orotate phosphoribosyltransferase [Elusimicrobia bacterium]|nr:orotate phosphoribosyltransferase [Elusimicrobiota bacterium]